MAQALACVRKMGSSNKSDKASRSADEFVATNPWKSEDVLLSRRNLPHLIVAGATYFLTFRSRITLPPEARTLALKVVHACDGERIHLDAAVVMPDHVHLILRLVGKQKLSAVLHLIKGRSARLINRRLGRTGSLWLDESFDHIIRHQAEFADKVEYIKQNPVKRGLVKDASEYVWLVVNDSYLAHPS